MTTPTFQHVIAINLPSPDTRPLAAPKADGPTRVPSAIGTAIVSRGAGAPADPQRRVAPR